MRIVCNEYNLATATNIVYKIKVTLSTKILEKNH